MAGGVGDGRAGRAVMDFEALVGGVVDAFDVPLGELVVLHEQ